MKHRKRVKTMIQARILTEVAVTALLLSSAAAQGIKPFSRDGFSLSKSDAAKPEESTQPFCDHITVPLGTARARSNPG
ncbi:MAG: hypothetical protein ACKVOI_19295 [Dongiaceae bacterium]